MQKKYVNEKGYDKNLIETEVARPIHVGQFQTISVRDCNETFRETDKKGDEDVELETDS